MTIDTITSRQILDSRGQPTLETTVHLDTGVSGIAAIPSGASTGVHEAFELRDAEPKHFLGQGVLKAVANVTGPIAKALKGVDVRDQRALDQRLIDLDGTVNKSALGANAVLSVSLAAMRAHAALTIAPLYRTIQATFDFPPVTVAQLPRPMMNVINGGRHADNGVTIQEFMIVPNGQTVAEQIERGVTVYHRLAEILKAKQLGTLVGDEGGYAPRLAEDVEALDLLVAAVQAAEYVMPEDIELAIDCAASTFYDPATERYRFGATKGGLTAVGMAGLLQEWLDRYHLRSIEDPLAEDDWAGWADLTAKLGAKTMIIGDDLFVTNRSRLERGIAEHAANAILIKPNQVGTLTETIDTIVTAKAAKYTVIVSHRSGETSDAFVTDLAVAVGAPFLKAGAPARGERVAKYNRLLAIAEELSA